jgi:hypothetical protein
MRVARLCILTSLQGWSAAEKIVGMKPVRRFSHVRPCDHDHMGDLSTTPPIPSNADRAALAKILDVIQAHEFGEKESVTCETTVTEIRRIAVWALNERTQTRRLLAPLTCCRMKGYQNIQRRLTISWVSNGFLSKAPEKPQISLSYAATRFTLTRN